MIAISICILSTVIYLCYFSAKIYILSDRQKDIKQSGRAISDSPYRRWRRYLLHRCRLTLFFLCGFTAIRYIPPLYRDPYPDGNTPHSEWFLKILVGRISWVCSGTASLPRKTLRLPRSHLRLYPCHAGDNSTNTSYYDSKPEHNPFFFAANIAKNLQKHKSSRCFSLEIAIFSPCKRA